MKKIIIFGAALAALTACQTMPYQPYARDVKKKPAANGIIALKLDHRDEDRKKAQDMMASNCGNTPVKVLEEGEVVVGQETTSSGTKSYNQGSQAKPVGSLFGLPITSGGADPSDTTNSKSSVTQLKEWQISYECETGSKKATR